MALRNWVIPVLACFAVLPFAGCSSADSSNPEQGTPTGGEERRISIGKADSLAGKCSADGVSYCGGKSSKKCYCDAACSQFGDCCADYKTACGGSGECKSTADCPAGQYCQSPEGCASPGVCKPKPTNVMCTAVVLQYCSCDGQTKSSTSGCIWDRYAHKGACETTPKTCGGIAGLPCATGQVCVDNPADSCDPNAGGADCGGICIEKKFCGGIASIPCPPGMKCVDDGDDNCDPNLGGADCGGMCVPSGGGCAPVMCTLFCANGFKKGADGCEVCSCADAPASSCSAHCGGPSADKSCYCDKACTKYGDCCADFAKYCDTRTPATGACVKNSNDACGSDADCKGGGCGGELCYNPEVSSGISTCECTAPTSVKGCGCVSGKCTWYN